LRAGFARWNGQPSEQKTGTGTRAVQQPHHGVIDEEKEPDPWREKENKGREGEQDNESPADEAPVERLSIGRESPGESEEEENTCKADDVIDVQSGTSGLLFISEELAVSRPGSEIRLFTVN